MLSLISNIIPLLFNLLFFFVPLILWPYNSELFEFNKMVLVYIFTVSITAFWAIRMIKEKKFIFRRTILDVPLLLFLISQTLSTLVSIDPRTSLLGYYSRFHGGLLSSICYSLLYWAYVSNINAKQTLISIKVMFLSAFLVCIYGILEHFGIDKDLWVQDVQNRVFSTLGQPNWLAAWLTGLFPLTWAFLLKKKGNWIYLGLSLLFFITLLFTKSRSGILGFVAADIIFWGYCVLKYKKEFLKQFVICHLSFVILFLVIGSPFRVSNIQSQVSPSGPALETGGTESAEIRKIVWKGAIDIWRHNILLGTGPETFAYSYYMHRPVEHNLVSEWDFIYNKAHNEYLNFMATTGTLGILSYMILIIFSFFQMLKVIPNNNLAIAMIAGYVSILVTNFFGFSVVPVALEFFLFPAMAFSLIADGVQKPKRYYLKNTILQNLSVFGVFIAATSFLFAVGRYWYSDILYNKGKQYNTANLYPAAFSYLKKVITLSPKEALYKNEVSQTAGNLAVAYYRQKKQEHAQLFTDLAISQSNEAVALSPANINLLRSRVTLFNNLSIINPKYLGGAKEALLQASIKAPTDAKLFYNLGIIYLKTGEVSNSLDTFNKAINLKPNYKEARLVYALTLSKNNMVGDAKEQLLYILEKIDPNDKTAKEELNKLK
ncbi:MAG: O-antigen ligase family protein [bacterium]